ncbi:hypothetical protein E2562_025590 [Oryza meyeriana var. granulata]|uniref:Uncharacterized protein n=1 Tax=Oryza meyeriana var. granulata TaxID=110450 RepID=A0A6G1E268_9ORYZ|nr:hypothetical protein E2562_025590 [Oryza meyeriana var. granulata]
MTSTSGGMDASFWCFMCSRLHRTSAGDDGLATCPRCAPRTALEAIVEVMDAGAFLHSCHPQAGARRAPGATAGSTRMLPAITVPDAARTCASMLHVGEDDAASAPDGLVLCELLHDGRFCLGRRSRERVFAVRILDREGKLVSDGVLSRLGAA